MNAGDARSLILVLMSKNAALQNPQYRCGEWLRAYYDVEFTDNSAAKAEFEENATVDVNEKSFLINLIDSPGHVDFSSEVTAALR